MVWQLALPMIISNISTPLLGLVDTAVMGHLPTADYLAGVALGSLIFGFIYWGFGFLRMGTTGLSAQAFGDQNNLEIKAILVRASLLALTIAGVVLMLQQYIAMLSFQLLESSTNIERLAQQYFFIRIWTTPATLMTYVLSGWFLGQQNVRSPLAIVLLVNGSNILLDFYLVVYLQMAIKGVALATVISEYSGLLLGLWLLHKQLKGNKSPWHWRVILNPDRFKAMLKLNNHIFIRNLSLIFAFAFFTAQSAKFGGVILAANTLLMNFQTFMAYALDGFAHAAEALVGRAIGAKDKQLFKQVVITSMAWSLLLALLFTLSYALIGHQIIKLLTSLESVRQCAYQYLPWLIALPLVSVTCFVLDGIFIGATWSKPMRDSMLFSLFLIYLPVWYWTQAMENHGLWLTMMTFMLARGMSMGILYRKLRNRVSLV